jgi:hypothetical protein
MAKRILLGSLVLFFELVASAPSAMAAESAHPDRFASAQLGYSTVSDDIGSGIAFGIEAGAKVWNNWGLGAFLRAGNHSNDITSFFFGIEGLYHPDVILDGLTLGVTAGSGKFTAQGLSGDSAFAFGAKAAYDYHFSQQPVSLGVDLSVTWCKPGDTMLTTVSPLLTGKWWF